MTESQVADTLGEYPQILIFSFKNYVLPEVYHV